MSVADTRRYLVPHLAETEGAAELLASIAVDDDASATLALDLAREAKGKAKALTDKRQSITAPIKGAVREIEELFRAPIRAYEEIEREMKSRVVDYRERAAREADRLLATVALAPEALAQAIAVAPAAQLDGAHVVERWAVDIVDAAKIPREYLVVDERAIIARIRETGDPDAVPGARGRKEKSITIRGEK